MSGSLESAASVLDPEPFQVVSGQCGPPAGRSLIRASQFVNFADPPLLLHPPPSLFNYNYYLYYINVYNYYTYYILKLILIIILLFIIYKSL